MKTLYAPDSAPALIATARELAFSYPVAAFALLVAAVAFAATYATRA